MHQKGASSPHQAVPMPLLRQSDAPSTRAVTMPGETGKACAPSVISTAQKAARIPHRGDPETGLEASPRCFSAVLALSTSWEMLGSKPGFGLASRDVQRGYARTTILGREFKAQQGQYGSLEDVWSLGLERSRGGRPRALAQLFLS